MSANDQVDKPRKRRRCVAACETCKRRKEGCDGKQPCQRCVGRGVGDSCHFLSRPSGAQQGFTPQRADQRTPVSLHSDARPQRDTANVAGSTQPTSEDNVFGQCHTYDQASEVSITSPLSGLDSTRMLQDQRGGFMFIGDSANLSFLQIIRRFVHEQIGPCTFVDDPLRYRMVESSPTSQTDGKDSHALPPPPQLSLTAARQLVQRYSLAASCVVDLFDEADILQQLPAFVQNDSCPGAAMIPRPIMFLVLAVGAQTSNDDRDDLAASLFAHGRQLAAQHLMDDASVATVQAYALITFYLLNAARRNAAFMHLGTAVRAAYALGLHRREVAMAFPPADCRKRECVWKVIRILDLFMSASLGRPPSTSETRDTEVEGDDYSASNDLCAIFEKVLTDVYSLRRVSTEALSHIGAHHRRWAARFHRGLATDRIEPSEMLEGGAIPNIGLLHVKEAYYWTIMLLTRPFLTESVSSHIKKANSTTAGAGGNPELCTFADSNKILVHACVDSAIRTVDLLSVLEDQPMIPKRLPFVVNSLFVAALVLGLAFFGDLYHLFPIASNLETAQKLLDQFPHDPIAVRNGNIVRFLREACDEYAARRARETMDHQRNAIGSMFGQIHGAQSRTQTREHSPRANGRANHAVNMSTLLNGVGAPGDAVNMTVYNNQPGGLVPPPLVTDVTNDLSYNLDAIVDFSNLPYPAISPRTLFFDSFDENPALFSTVSDNYLYGA